MCFYLLFVNRFPAAPLRRLWLCSSARTQPQPSPSYCDSSPPCQTRWHSLPAPVAHLASQPDSQRAKLAAKRDIHRLWLDSLAFYHTLAPEGWPEDV